MSDEEAFKQFLLQAGFVVVLSGGPGMTTDDPMIVLLEKDSADTKDYTFNRGEYGDEGRVASFMFDNTGRFKARFVGDE